MRTARRLLILAIGGLGLLLARPAPVRAEKPLSSPAVLEKTATHVVRGEIARVFTRARREGMSEITQYIAEVHVTAVEKGAGVPLDRPLYARCWSRAWKGAGYPPPGTSGHAPLPQEGRDVRLYLARNAYDGFGTQTHDGGYDVIGVNGVQPLSPEEVAALEAEAAPKAAPSFPASWLGVWEGPLTISKPGREEERTKMVVVIQTTEEPGRWAFRIRYGDQPLRRYELIARDAAAGAWSIDEGNSVVLPATVLGGELVSSFSLDGRFLTARYRLDGDFLRFDLVEVGLAPDETTGGDGTPAVGGHAVRVLQRAVLRR